MYTPAPTRYDDQSFYRRCGRSGLKLPLVSLGLWHNFGGSDPFENGRAIVRRAFDLGITHFDLANNYGPPPGSAEETFGRIVRADLAAHRDELLVSTKAGYDMWAGPYGNFGSRKHLLASLDQSLRRLGLPYVDILYHHRPDAETPLLEPTIFSDVLYSTVMLPPLEPRLSSMAGATERLALIEKVMGIGPTKKGTVKATGILNAASSMRL